MTGNRMSSLPIAQFCGMSSKLDTGGGRAAVMSTAFHAKCAGGDDYEQKLAKLTDEERLEISLWKRPEDVFVQLASGQNFSEILLKYEASEKEIEVALDQHAGLVAADDPTAETVGHLDMAWLLTFPNGKRVAYVGDIKKSEFTSEVDSLQLAAYGFAWAAKHEADAFCCGIWAATEGRWTWGDIVYLEKQSALDLWDRILFAARNTGNEFNPGAHCKSCWSRARCPTWSLPPSQLVDTLAPLAEGRELTKEELPGLVLQWQRLKELEEKVGPMLKAAADRLGGAYDASTNKVWKASQQGGRESVSIVKLRASLGAQAEQFISRGEGYKVYKWVKA